ADDFFYAGFARRPEQFFRACHIDRTKIVQGQRLEIVGAVHQRIHARERAWGDFRAELKRDRPRTGLWLARQFQNVPAGRGEIVFDAAADVAAASGDGAGFVHLLTTKYTKHTK